MNKTTNVPVIVLDVKIKADTLCSVLFCIFILFFLSKLTKLKRSDCWPRIDSNYVPVKVVWGQNLHFFFFMFPFRINQGSTCALS